GEPLLGRPVALAGPRGERPVCEVQDVVAQAEDDDRVIRAAAIQGAAGLLLLQREDRLIELIWVARGQDLVAQPQALLELVLDGAHGQVGEALGPGEIALKAK